MLGWTAGQLSVVAELSENCVWNALTAQGGGDLHVFVPVRDRGLDGVAHRLSDGAYLDVQVKARSKLEDGQMHLVVWAEELVFDAALMVGVHLDGERLGPYCLVCTEAEFKRRAHLGTGDGKPMYSASINFHPERGGRWADLMVSSDRLGERFGARSLPGFDLPADQVARGDRGGLGQVGEAEVLRRLAEEAVVALFRPRTDLETVELVARHLTGGGHLGLQVKCEGGERGVPCRVDVRLSSFRPHPTTWLVGLSWLWAEGAFHEECLFIPSVEIEGMVRVDGIHGAFDWLPGGAHQARVDPWRRPLSELARLVVEQLGG